MSIYREEILDHYKNPRNFGTVENPTIQVEEDNITCGDHVELFFKIKNNPPSTPPPTKGGIGESEDEKSYEFEDIKFQGKGCALSIAGTSLLTEMIKDKSLSEVEKISQNDIINFVGGSISPARVNCILLGFSALQKSLKKLQIGEDKEKKNLISRETNLGEIGVRWPKAGRLLLDYGLHCAGCIASGFDTVEMGAKVHGMSDEEIDEMVEELNKIVSGS